MDARSIPINPDREEAVYGIEEVVAERLQMKSDKVCPQHPFQDLPFPRADLKRFRRGPGDMPKEADHGIRPSLPNQLGEQGKMIILNEEKRTLLAAFLKNGIGEFLIHLHIRLPILLLKMGTVMGQMTERPDRLVGEPIIIPFLFFPCEPDPAKGIKWRLRRNEDLVLAIHKVTILLSGPVGDPDTTRRPKDGIKRRDKTTRRNDDLRLTLQPDLPIRFPV
jgi:hypothetical protein